MSTYGLGLEILNSVKNSSKRKETMGIKNRGEKTVTNSTQEG